MSGMLTVFFFARLWRRANVMTDVEFSEIRYSGRPAAFLRGFRALYLAIPINLIIIGWVTRAMIKILTISLDVSPVVAVGICFVVDGLLRRGGGAVGSALDRSRPVRDQDERGHRAGGLRGPRGRWHRCDGAKLTAHFGSETAALSVMPDCRRRPTRHLGLRVDAAPGPLHVSVRAVVGGLVPRRRAGRRRIRRAAHLRGPVGARRRARHAVVSDRALRTPPVAVDRHRPGDGDPVPRRSRTRNPATSTRSSTCSRRRGADSCWPASPPPTCRRSARSSTGARRTSSTTSTSDSCARTSRSATTCRVARGHDSPVSPLASS